MKEEAIVLEEDSMIAINWPARMAFDANYAQPFTKEW